MRRFIDQRCVKALAVLTVAGAIGGCAHRSSGVASADNNPRPGAVGHRAHEEWQGSYPSVDSQRAFRVVRTIKPPVGFLGNLAYDPSTNRLWLVSMGKPTTKDGSKLYQIDPETSQVVRAVDM